MNSYMSGFADLLEKYESYQKASGSWSENANGLNIKYFDRYCALHYPGQPLCQEMVDEWCRKRGTETNASCFTRTGGIRSFIHYLRERGLTTVEPTQPPKPEGRTYIPYSFTEDELRRFFHECDWIIPLRPELKYKMKKITCPVFFRLLYSSGIRTTEARYLKREDVDLEHGVLNIRKTKGYDQHYVALHESMTKLLKQYDKAAESIRPDRTYFFETPNGKFYSRQWVTQTFQCLWEKANGKQNRAVAYDLRHNYAVVNINRWADDIFEFGKKLHYLSKSMGHRSIDSTLYYYLITPCLADILLKKQKKVSTNCCRRWKMKKSDDAVKIARYISEFLDTYAPNFLTTSEHTLKSYRNALGLYICFLETESVTPGNFSRHCFEREKIEKWIVWLKDSRNCSSETCNVRLGSLRVFLEFLGIKDIEYLYLYQEAQKIKRQKYTKKKVSGFTRDAVAAMLAVPDVSTQTGKRDKIRTAYLLPKVVAYIKVYLNAFHDNPPDPEAYLFYSRVGGKHTKLSEPALAKRIKICAEAAHEKCPDVPLDAHAHQFRHAKASHWLEDGINVVQVSFLLGHEQLETTMRYLDITTEDKIKALATLEDKSQKTVPKKWKNKSGTLTDFCGLKK